MTTINELSTVKELYSDDAMPVYSAKNGDTRRAPLSALALYIAAQLGITANASRDFITQRAAPYDNGPDVAISAGEGASNTHLIMVPSGALGAAKVILPLQNNAADSQEIIVTTTQAISAFTVSGNGSNVVGAPTTMAKDGFFKLRYDKPAIAWYRIG